MSNPNPKYHLKHHDGLTATQRKSLGLGNPYAPRTRMHGEATSVMICNSNTTGRYFTGDGEVHQPMRAGALRAMEIQSKGYRT